MLEFWLLQRRNDEYNVEYQVVEVRKGMNPLYGYKFSWELAANIPFESRSSAWQFQNIISRIEVMV